MKPKPKILIMSVGEYILTLLLTVSLCVVLYLSSVQNRQEWESILENVRLACTTSRGNIDKLTQDNAALSAQISSLSAEISFLRQEVEHKQDKQDRGGERLHYELSAAERDLVERVVMAESEDEPYTGQMLVCQCILNACRLNNKRPAAIIKQYAYATRRPEPSESVRKAVAAVFDKGETVTDEPIIYFYAPALVESTFHERQRFVLRCGGHKFFAEK